MVALRTAGRCGGAWPHRARSVCSGANVADTPQALAVPVPRAQAAQLPVDIRASVSYSALRVLLPLRLGVRGAGCHLGQSQLEVRRSLALLRQFSLQLVALTRATPNRSAISVAKRFSGSN
jgi:hypothetical protein